MSKKIVFYIIFIICFFNFLTTVSAEDISCDYGDVGLKIFYKNGVVDYDYNSLSNEWYRGTPNILYDANVDMYMYGEIILKQEELKKIFNNYACPSSVYLCEHTVWGIEMPSILSLSGSIGMTVETILEGLTFGYADFNDFFDDKAWALFQLDKKNLYIMGQSTYEDEYEDDEGGKITSTVLDNIQAGQEFCTVGDNIIVAEQVVDVICGTVSGLGGTVADLVYNNDKTLVGWEDLHCYRYEYPEDGPYQPINIDCGAASQYFVLLDAYIKKYESCDEDDIDCKITNKKLVNEKVEQLGPLCGSILSNFSYNGSQKECIDNCLSINEKIKGIDEIKYNEDYCGFSQKLIIYISNIVKWCKYIVPVIVIILGIVDFIKTIVADKEDGMKKSQEKFIKRLVAAAIIFIIPVIIDFILEVMGITSNGCGIIDL